MPIISTPSFGINLKAARRAAGLTQTALASAARVPRLQVVRMEAGATIPRLDEVVRLAGVLKVPLEWMVARRLAPGNDLKGIAHELYHIGLRDLEVSDAGVPGAFRHAEEIVVLAVRGDRPEPRVVEAIPFVLARAQFRAALVAAFAGLHDRRVRTRLAWLSEITLALGKLRTMPLGIESEASLKSLIRYGETTTVTDSLGHPATGSLPPIWKRWKINYAGTLQDFMRRTIEVNTAYRSSLTIEDL